MKIKVTKAVSGFQKEISVEELKLAKVGHLQKPLDENHYITINKLLHDVTPSTLNISVDESDFINIDLNSSIETMGYHIDYINLN